MDSYLILWIVLAAVFAVAELATMAFVALYIALGAIAAAIVAANDGDVVWQIAALVVVGAVLMAVTRPLLKARLEAPDYTTNVRSIVGRGAIVTIAIDNDRNTGQIRVGTEFWTARTPEGMRSAPIPVDSHVTIVSVEGVTARVVAAEPAAEPVAAPTPDAP